jgi:hypothetical protein
MRLAIFVGSGVPKLAIGRARLAIVEHAFAALAHGFSVMIVAIDRREVPFKLRLLALVFLLSTSFSI